MSSFLFSLLINKKHFSKNFKLKLTIRIIKVLEAIALLEDLIKLLIKAA
jgi:hypothetical protein